MRTIVVLAVGLATCAVHAQESADPAKQAEAMRQALLAAQTQGSGNASRPGDESLSCEALQQEMVAIGTSPEMQAFAQQAGAGAQADFDKLAQAQQAMPGPGRGIARSIAQGVVSAVPGVGKTAARAQQRAAATQAEQMQADANANMQRMLAQSGQSAGIMGPAMRGQRLIELGQAKKCDWAQGQGVPGLPPDAPAGVPLPVPTPSR